MTNTKEVATINYEVNNEEVKLSPAMVRKYLVNGNGKVTDQEVVMFMQLCRYQKLNPFLKEAYLVKFGNQAASIITSKEAFMKRAENNKHYKGFKAGIVVARGEEMKHLDGAIKMPKDELIGAWAEVYRDDRDEPSHVEISLEEFSKGQATWKQMPMNMIRKTALVNALREAFPENLGSLYTEDDKQPIQEVQATEENESKPTVDDLLNDEPKEVKPEPVEVKEEESKTINVDELMAEIKANNGTKKEVTDNGNEGNEASGQESLFDNIQDIPADR
ncbi:phage recombination protein Bet [Apilactobacillus nanyangensis]|uniref:phage recombination protein Bet n=1 Tax=Apilactobacillus nanyangensis TaxID=2799579 RepID=UPI0019409028|nr:phage recombination protein Bet [Apilactobacillus nanyangensis]